MVSYSRLNGSVFRAFSVTNIVLWVVCTALVTAITVRYSNLGGGVSANPVGALDFVFAGLWSSLFYGIAGMIGLCASYRRQRAHLIPMAVLCAAGAAGAVITAGIAGHIAVYITENVDDVNNSLCHPAVLYPPIFTEDQAKEDCLTWAILEYLLMSYSIVAAVVNVILLATIGVAMTGPKEKSNLV